MIDVMAHFPQNWRPSGEGMRPPGRALAHLCRSFPGCVGCEVVSETEVRFAFKAAPSRADWEACLLWTNPEVVEPDVLKENEVDYPFARVYVRWKKGDDPAFTAARKVMAACPPPSMN